MAEKKVKVKVLEPLNGEGGKTIAVGKTTMISESSLSKLEAAKAVERVKE